MGGCLFCWYRMSSTRCMLRQLFYGVSLDAMFNRGRHLLVARTVLIYCDILPINRDSASLTDGLWLREIVRGFVVSFRTSELRSVLEKWQTELSDAAFWQRAFLDFQKTFDAVLFDNFQKRIVWAFDMKILMKAPQIATRSHLGR